MTRDWVSAYATTRVAFPPDAWLHTEDAEGGGLRFTAYGTAYDPPLPGRLKVPVTHPFAARPIVTVSGGLGGRVLHHPRVFYVTYEVRSDDEVETRVAADAAQQEWKAAAKR